MPPQHAQEGTAGTSAAWSQGRGGTLDGVRGCQAPHPGRPSLRRKRREVTRTVTRKPVPVVEDPLLNPEFRPRQP